MILYGNQLFKKMALYLSFLHTEMVLHEKHPLLGDGIASQNYRCRVWYCPVKSFDTMMVLQSNKLCMGMVQHSYRGRNRNGKC
jgi:hypothetical protein